MKELLTGLALAALAATAQADIGEDFHRFIEGSYGGAAIGVESRTTEGCPRGTTNCEDLRTLPWKFWGGWRVSETLGTEISYIHFGTLRNQTIAPNNAPLTETTTRAQSIGLTFAPTFAINQVSTVVARIGVASVKTEYDSPTDSNSGWRGEPLLGAALQWNVGRSLPDSAGILRGFSLEFGWDTTRIKQVDSRKWIHLFTIGGGFEF